MKFIQKKNNILLLLYIIINLTNACMHMRSSLKKKNKNKKKRTFTFEMRLEHLFTHMKKNAFIILNFI